jgi:hypothetical protein
MSYALWARVNLTTVTERELRQTQRVVLCSDMPEHQKALADAVMNAFMCKRMETPSVVGSETDDNAERPRSADGTPVRWTALFVAIGSLSKRFENSAGVAATVKNRKNIN